MPALQLRFSILVLAAALGSTPGPAAIPADRLPHSGHWGGTGIPGGIPDVSVWRTLDVRAQFDAAGDGIADDAPAIQAAIDQALAGGVPTVVFLPAGTYRLGSGLVARGPIGSDNASHPFSLVLRGAGPTETIILADSTSTVVQFAPAGGYSARTIALATPTGRGVSELTFAEEPPTWAPTPGHCLVVARENTDAGVVAPAYMVRTTSQIVRLTEVAGRTVRFEPGLNVGFPGDFVAFGRSPPYRCGVEELSIEQLRDNQAHNIAFTLAEECWVRNVESANASGWHIRLTTSAFCEVRRCYIHDGWNGGGNSIYGVGLFQFSCGNRIEDNIFVRTRHAMILEYGGQNNVFAYNYSRDTINEKQLATDWIMGDISSHGGNPQWNLWEGNVAQRLSWDNVLGGSGHLTAFRNQIQRVGINPTPWLWAIDVMRNNYGANIVGNVLLTPGQTVNCYAAPGPGGHGYIRRLGMNSDGDTDFANADPLVAASLLYHLNWDHVFGAGGPSYLDPGTTSAPLPGSYYLDRCPEWWDSGPWPAIGPDLPVRDNANPAYRRWLAFADTAQADKRVLFANLPPPRHYAQWRALHFGSDAANDAISGPDADPDGCGLTNFARYAFDLPARGPVAPPVALGTADTATGRVLTLTFPRRAEADDLSYSVEASTDLATWTAVPGLSYGSGSGPVTAENTVALADADTPRRFLRLRVATP